MAIRENLKALMEHRKVSQYALSAATGVPQPTINRILKGLSKDPKTETVKNLAAFFGVTAEDMRGTSPEIRPDEDGAFSKEEMELIRAWRTLPQERRQSHKESLFLEAVAIEQMPWLKTGKPQRESYDAFERRMRSLHKVKKSSR